MGIFGWTVLGLVAGDYLPLRRRRRPSGTDATTHKPAPVAPDDPEAAAAASDEPHEG